MLLEKKNAEARLTEDLAQEAPSKLAQEQQQTNEQSSLVAYPTLQETSFEPAETTKVDPPVPTAEVYGDDVLTTRIEDDHTIDQQKDRFEESGKPGSNRDDNEVRRRNGKHDDGEDDIDFYAEIEKPYEKHKEEEGIHFVF